MIVSCDAIARLMRVPDKGTVYFAEAVAQKRLQALPLSFRKELRAGRWVRRVMVQSAAQRLVVFCFVDETQETVSWIKGSSIVVAEKTSLLAQQGGDRS